MSKSALHSRRSMSEIRSDRYSSEGGRAREMKVFPSKARATSSFPSAAHVAVNEYNVVLCANSARCNTRCYFAVYILCEGERILYARDKKNATLLSSNDTESVTLVMPHYFRCYPNLNRTFPEVPLLYSRESIFQEVLLSPLSLSLFEVNFLLEKQNVPRDITKTRVIREEIRAKRSGNGWAYFGDIRRIISLSNAHLLRSICTWSPRNPCIVASRILHHRKRERERERTDERTARGTVVEPGSQRAISRGVPAYERGVMAQPAWLGSCRRERDRISSSGTNVVKRENGEQRRDGRSCEQASRSVARESGGKLSLERLHEGNPASLPRSLPLGQLGRVHPED